MGREGLDLLRGTLDLMILTTLSSGELMHGFAMLDWIRETTENAIDVEEGALYPALHRLERRGLLKGTWGISNKGRRAKYYLITRSGRRRLEEGRTQWREYAAAVGQLADARGIE
jgi:transcriptional regulator